MFNVRTFQLSKSHTSVALIFDEQTDNACLYPLLYSISRLRFQSLSTQQADCTAIKFWYEFWYEKYRTSFCYSFLTGTYNPNLILQDIDSFTIYLENNRNLKHNLIRLRNSNDVNYATIAQRLRSIFKFTKFLCDEYWNEWYQVDLDRSQLIISRRKIDLILQDHKKLINKFSSRNSSYSAMKHSYKSMTKDMLSSLYIIIKPSSSTKLNTANPFVKDVQFRNFLIIHLLVNYGLRVGELMLLSIKSIKKSIQSDSYSLIVTNTEDEYDTRARKPNIKNEPSHRVIKLDSRDYHFIQIYIDRIRQQVPTEILFTSTRKPFSALSYSSVKKIFLTLNNKLKQEHPQYFNSQNYDSLEKLTPHVCRHTWAYTTLSYAFDNYQGKNIMQSDSLLRAQEDLRALGGWSVTSQEPLHYGKRFIVDRANFTNLSRISQSFDIQEIYYNEAIKP